MVWEANCLQPRRYNKVAIESEILQIVQRRLLAYQLQDLVCTKCRGVKDNNMKTNCQCSGTFENGETPEQFRMRYAIVGTRAKDMVVSWLVWSNHVGVSSLMRWW